MGPDEKIKMQISTYKSMTWFIEMTALQMVSCRGIESD